MTQATTTERKVSRGVHERGEMATPQPAPVPPERITTTMGQYGDKLPIGILDPEGGLHKDIVLKTWKTRDDRELGKKIAVDAGMVEHVPLIVANMCTRLGPHDMQALDDATKSVILSTMYMADVFYVYALLRARTMGNKLSLEVSCQRPGCNVRFPYAGDLSTIEVVAVDDIDAIVWRYDLEDPITIRRQTVTHFSLSYPKWSTIELARGNSNEAEVKALAIQGSIIGINDDLMPVALTLNELDELTKRDFEGIQDGINKHFLGPKMGLEGSCTPQVCERFKRGGHPFKLSIDWAYKSFFAASSR